MTGTPPFNPPFFEQYKQYMARVRTTTVKGKRYVQAVKSPPPRKAGGHWQIKVLESFGELTPESDLRARVWMAAYNSLIETSTLYHGHLHHTDPAISRPVRLAFLAVYGQTLGLRTVEELTA